MIQQLMAHMVRHEAAQSRGQRNWFSLWRQNGGEIELFAPYSPYAHVPNI